MSQSLRARYGAWALVAGASQGFGASFAIELATRGMNVVLVSRRGDRLDDLAARLSSEFGVESRCLVLVSSLAGLQGAPRVGAYSASKAFNIILAEALWGELSEQGIDVSVCCAGAMPTPGYLASTDWKSPGMLSPEEAARQTLDALGKGPRFVPGLINRLSAQLMGRLLTRKAAIRLIAKNTEHLS